MGSVFGDRIKVSVFGESHGPAIGVTIDGFPAGLHLDTDYIDRQMARRRPSGADYSTKRSEDDAVEILSGVLNRVTTGAPITAVIKNKDAKSVDYEKLKTFPRPSHADYPASLRYDGNNDVRGGGHFSGRLTAPLVFAGALCRLALLLKGIVVGAHISNILDVKDTSFDPCAVTVELLEAVGEKDFPVLSDEAGAKMKERFATLRESLDSGGGSIECAAVNLPAGLGDPMFDGVENSISRAIFGIPAVKGLQFGAGFDFAYMTGSRANDSYYYENDVVKTKTNRNGGILGGITTGMPLLFKVAIKPTPSISKEQDTINVVSKENVKLTITGRHDPCIVPRAVPVVEAVTAIALVDLMLKSYGNWW